MDLAYKRHSIVLLGVHFGSDSSTVHSGTHVYWDRHTDAPAFLEPTSFKCIWLGCCYYCEHPCINNVFEHTDTSHEHCFDFSMSHLHRTAFLSVGAGEHCSWCRRSTSSEAYNCQSDTLLLPHGSHHIYFHVTDHILISWLQLQIYF